MRLLASLLSLMVVATLLAPASSAASNASTDTAGQRDLCFGQVPTIVGMSGQGVVGTEGPDVVVTNGAPAANLLGGDDLLCLTGHRISVNEPGSYSTGPGADRIDSSKGTGLIFLYPGLDSDEVIGGQADEFVDAASERFGPPGAVDADVIATYGGRDSVWASGDDIVDLGPGWDRLDHWLGAIGGTFVGGAAGDLLVLNFARTGPHMWNLSNSTGRLTRDNIQVTAVHGFTHFTVRARGRFSFVGSKEDEKFFFHHIANGSVGAVRMRGGNDRVRLDASTPEGSFDGGDGKDLLNYVDAPHHWLAPGTSMVLNLKTGLLRNAWADGSTTRSALRFEHAAVTNWDSYVLTTIKGTRAANRLRFMGPGRSELFGKAGNDLLNDRDGASLLVGGPGHDIANGRAGIDRCEAEIRLHCEL